MEGGEIGDYWQCMTEKTLIIKRDGGRKIMKTIYIKVSNTIKGDLF